MGDDLGGISGEQVIQVHKVMQTRIKKERKLAKRVEKIISRLQTYYLGCDPESFTPPQNDVA